MRLDRSNGLKEGANKEDAVATALAAGTVAGTVAAAASRTCNFGESAVGEVDQSAGSQDKHRTIADMDQPRVTGL